MAEYILLIFVVFLFLWIPYKYYEPKIEIIELVKNYRVYLWYNKWEGPACIRVHKFLFET